MPADTEAIGKTQEAPDTVVRGMETGGLRWAVERGPGRRGLSRRRVRRSRREGERSARAASRKAPVGEAAGQAP